MPTKQLLSQFIFMLETNSKQWMRERRFRNWLLSPSRKNSVVGILEVRNRNLLFTHLETFEEVQFLTIL